MVTVQFVVKSHGTRDKKQFRRGNIADVSPADAERLVKFGVAVITDAKPVSSALEETTFTDPTTSPEGSTSEEAQKDQPDGGKLDGTANTSRRR